MTETVLAWPVTIVLPAPVATAVVSKKKVNSRP